MVDETQLNYTYLFENNNISKNNQSGEILLDSLLKQHLTTNLFNILLAASLEFVMIVNINRLIYKVFIANKQTWMIGHKFIILIIKLL